MRCEPLDILRVMPHRNPMLLVDAIEADLDASSALAFKNISFAEGCYRSADSATRAEDLAYPLSLLVESFGQGAGLLLSRRGFLDEASSTHAVVFGEFQDIEILQHAYPGDRLRHEVQLEYAGAQLAIFSGQTWVDERLIARFGRLKAFLVARDALAQQVQHGA